MKLTDLEPQFLRYRKDKEGRQLSQPVESIAEAHGVCFLCPKCFAANGGPEGTHMIRCWSRSAGTPDDASPGPGRWKLVGTGFTDLTLEADPPSKKHSVLLLGGCKWHGFVTKGEAA
jgi:hypothetical protein